MNWLESAVGGSLFFQEVLLGEEQFETTIRGFSNSKQMLQAIASDRHAIGFGSFTSVAGTKLLKIRAGVGTFAIEPTMENVRSARYPLSRYLYWTLAHPFSENLRKISNWALSTEGQVVVESVGYFPLNAIDHAKAKEIALAK